MIPDSSISSPTRQFTIYPAIDLRKGKVVRLYQGNPDQERIYGSDPSEMAQRWIDQGASWLHVVNLDGAFGQPDQVNRKALEGILQVATSTSQQPKIQFGGGLRSLADCKACLEMGIARVILGTLAVEAPGEVIQALQRWGAERIGLAIDARDGLVQVRGWFSKTQTTANELGSWFVRQGGRLAVHTDIARDGSGHGLNLAASQELARTTGLSVIASGGVASLQDVREVRLTGLDGIIIGRALYDGVIGLQEALRC